MSAADRGVCPGCGEVFCECRTITTPVKASGLGENVTFPEPLYTMQEAVEKLLEHPHQLKIQKWTPGLTWLDCNYVDEILAILNE